KPSTMRCASISEFSTAAIANSERTIQSSLLAPANLPDGVVLATNSSACAIALWTVWPGCSDVDTMFTPAALGTQLRARGHRLLARFGILGRMLGTANLRR